MFTLAFLIIAGLYFSLFVFANKCSKYWSVRLLLWAVLLSPLVYKTWDMPVGHAQFKALCKKEGGMKVFVSNPARAKRIRLEGRRFGSLFAEGALNRRKSLQQVEAQDKKYDFTNPVAYALYERGSDGKVVSSLMDAVERPGGHGELKVIRRASSEADYILSYSQETRPIRILVEHYTLRRRADWRVIATTTRMIYEWTDPNKTLLARTAIDECGSGIEDFYQLLDMISSPEVSQRRY